MAAQVTLTSRFLSNLMPARPQRLTGAATQPTSFLLLRLIIWDEAPMMHKHVFEYLDRASRDVTRVDALLVAGFILERDFRQIPTFIPGAAVLKCAKPA